MSEAPPAEPRPEPEPESQPEPESAPAAEPVEAPPQGAYWPLVVGGVVLLAGILGAPLLMLYGLSTLRPPTQVVIEALQRPTFLELYSLDGSRPLPPTEGFHGFPVLGSVAVAEREEREEMVREFLFGVHENTGMSAPCFTPNHGLRVTNEAGRTFDLVVSFECLSVRVYEGKEAIGTMRMSVTPQPYFVGKIDAAELPRTGKPAKSTPPPASTAAAPTSPAATTPK